MGEGVGDSDPAAVAICWGLLAAWLRRCVIGSNDLGKLGWADQLLGCAGRSILTFPFFSFLSFLLSLLSYNLTLPSPVIFCQQHHLYTN
jgi:hypothetical protein